MSCLLFSFSGKQDSTPTFQILSFLEGQRFWYIPFGRVLEELVAAELQLLVTIAIAQKAAPIRKEDILFHSAPAQPQVY